MQPAFMSTMIGLMQTMIRLLCVGAGGFLGASLRYLLGLIPYQADFPAITFLINLVGCIIIGIVAEVAFIRVDDIDANLVLFLKTGFCGGFTTLSAFGLETWVLFDKGKYLLGGGYILATFAACLIGVLIGRTIARTFLGVSQA